MSHALYLPVATMMEQVAAEIMLPRFRRLAAGAVRNKSGPLDLVTDADEGAERAIAAGLAARFPGCLVVGEEGGFTADPTDSGNWTGGAPGRGECRGTRWGISAAAYPLLDIARLQLTDAQAIYRRDYWDRLQGDALPPALALARALRPRVYVHPSGGTPRAPPPSWRTHADAPHSRAARARVGRAELLPCLGPRGVLPLSSTSNVRRCKPL